MVRKGAARWLATLLGVCALGCTDLPEIDTGECGNGVREDRETCDTFALNPGGRCRPKGSVGECHLDCRLQSDGTRGTCPEGWGCDRDGLCRKPVGLGESIELPLKGVESLASGDYDGDGRSDLVTREPVDAALRGKPTLHYLDENGAIRMSLPFPKAVGEPFVGDIDGDRLDDFVFTTFLVGVLRGRPDRNWVPETFSSYRVPDSHLRVVGVAEDAVISNAVNVVVFGTLQDRIGLFVPLESGALQLMAPLPAPVEMIAGDIRTGNIVDGVDSPCNEVVVAYRGASSFSAFDVCDWDSTIGFPAWKTAAKEQKVALQPPAEIQSTLVADLNGDDHLDVLIGTNAGVYAAYGDGKKLATATRFFLHRADQPQTPIDIPMPLAVGEFSGDRTPDFVFPESVLCSLAHAEHPSGYPVYGQVAVIESVRWTEALIADMNGNGKPDIVAASRDGLGIQFFNGTDGLFVAGSSIPTAGPVEHLSIGDFDGDQLNDVAFIEHAVSSSESDSLRIAFGSPAGPPQAPITVAQMDAAEQVTAFADAGFWSLAVASSDRRDGTMTGQVATLIGGDRLPLALHALVRLGEDGSIARSLAYAVSVGAFGGPGKHDLVALSHREDTFEFWLIPAINDNASAPMRLSGALPRGFEPSALDAGAISRLAVAATALDVDGDGVDESLWMMPAAEGTRCGLFWFDVDQGARALLPRGVAELTDPCARASIKAKDLDGDGRSDLLLASSDLSETTGALTVLFNDGNGKFKTPVKVSMPGEVPRAFTFLRRTQASPGMFAYVTGNALELVGSTSDLTASVARGAEFFDVRQRLLALERGTAVVSGDFNGDGVEDLAVADAGKVRLSLTQLELP